MVRKAFLCPVAEFGFAARRGRDRRVEKNEKRRVDRGKFSVAHSRVSCPSQGRVDTAVDCAGTHRKDLRGLVRTGRPATLRSTTFESTMLRPMLVYAVGASLAALAIAQSPSTAPVSPQPPPQRESAREFREERTQHAARLTDNEVLNRTMTTGMRDGLLRDQDHRGRLPRPERVGDRPRR